jgi:hypothetical protein
MVSSLLFAALGCGGGGHSNVRVLLASTGQSNVDVVINGSVVATDLLYGAATSYISVKSGAVRIQLEPTGTKTPFLDQTISTSSSGQYTFVVDNSSTSLSSFTLTDDVTTPTNINLRIVNAALDLPTADVYIVPQGTSISSVPPTISNLAFGQASSYQTLTTAGAYEVYFTQPGTTFAFIDTGAISLATGQNRTLFAMDTQFGGGFTFLVLADLN